MEKLSELSIELRHREGPLHVVADALSRIPQDVQLHLNEADATMA